MTQAMNALYRISIGADHGGFDLKAALIRNLSQDGHTLTDRGTAGHESVDYPDFAECVGQDVVQGLADFGILICTTGIGISISANKIHGIRAALVSNEDGAAFSRLHNDANVICFGAKYQTPYMATKLVRIFLETTFEGGRHQRRVDKINHLENETPPVS